MNNSLDLNARTKQYALSAIELFAKLPKDTISQHIGKQMFRSATSIGAHYREATRSKSNADFVSKLETALQELDETVYWLELLLEVHDNLKVPINQLISSTRELSAIITSIVKKVKLRISTKA